MFKRNGGVKKIFAKDISGHIVVYVLVDVQDSMGANTVNTILEGL